MIKKIIESFLSPFIKNEEDKIRLSTVIIPSFAVRTGYYVLSYLIMLVLTRTLGPSRYGVFTFTFSIIYLLMNFSSYGFEVVAIKYTSAYLSKGKKELWKGMYKWATRSLLIISILVSMAIALFIIIFVFVLHLIPQKDYTLPILACCSIVPVYSLMNFYSNLLRGQHKSLLAFLPDNTVKPLFLLISLLMFRFIAREMNLNIAILMNLVSFLVAFIFILTIFLKTNNMRGVKAEYDKRNWRNFVGSLFILTVVSSLYNQIDSIMLRSLKDSSQVGIYYAANRVASSLLFFMYVMNMIIAPSIARLNTPEDKEKLQRMITRTIRWVMLFSFPVFIAIIVFSAQIMKLSGPQFAPGNMALIIVCCGQLIDIGFGPVGYFALMTGNQKYNTIYMAIGIGLNIILNLVLTPTMGFIGTAIATSLCMIFWNAAMFFTIKKKTGIRTWIFG